MKTEIKVGKYKFMSSDDKEFLQYIVDLIVNDEVANWSQLRIKSLIHGWELNENVFIALLLFLSNGSVYAFLQNSIENDDDCTTFMKHPETIERILNLEGYAIVGHPKEDKFKCTSFLWNFELKHPEIFLNYFLKHDHNIHIGNHGLGWRNMLMMIIHRTRLRATKNEKYVKFLEELESLKMENSIVSTMMQ